MRPQQQPMIRDGIKTPSEGLDIALIGRKIDCENYDQRNLCKFRWLNAQWTETKPPLCTIYFNVKFGIKVKASAIILTHTEAKAFEAIQGHKGSVYANKTDIPSQINFL